MMLLILRHYFHVFILFSFFSIACREHQDPSEDTTTASNRRERQSYAFTEVTAETGLSGFHHDNGARGNVYFPEQMGSGGGFVDYNGDNWLDILLVGGGPIETDPSRSIKALRLYKNNRDGTFSEVTEEAELSGIQAYGMGITAADYDNDGDEDFYFTTLHENYLFRNDGGKFSSVGEETNVSGQPVWSSAALFFDADRDGDLDLYVANYADWSPETDIYCSIEGVVILDTEGASDLAKQYGRKVYCVPSLYEGIPSLFYRNNGDGSFTDETEQAGFLPTPGKSLGVAEFDFNRDGWPDVVVANDAEPDLLYKNNGDGTFKEIGKPTGIAFDEMGNARAGMGIDVGVVDESGQESIFIGNFSSEMIGVYKYIGNDRFLDRAVDSKIGRPSFLSLTFGLILFDVEYDGDLDMLAANGHVWAVRPTLDGSTYRQRSQLFANRGDGVFTGATSVPGGVLDQLMVARGASYGDYDRDGDLDVLLTENGGPVHLWRNELSGANYLRVRLKGRTSNNEGLGSQLIAVVGKNKMYRRMRTGSSYLSQSEKVVSFGLGDRTQVDSLLVQWPAGQVDVFTDLQGNQELRVLEGAGRYEVIPAASDSSQSRKISNR